jgi:uncharacterized cupin superfamily protein
VNEARLEDAGSGLAPVTEGWFVVNVRDAEWFSSETRGAASWFANEYGESPIEFAQFGINLSVLEPGQSGVYHAEANQEAFLVLAGECRLLVEGEERPLRAWDFFHSPPWTEHAFVGAGDGLCVILMVGAHLSPDVRYPVSELAARYGASVEKETSDPEQVYATAERFRRERPPYWSRLPWARAVRSSRQGSFWNTGPGERLVARKEAKDGSKVLPHRILPGECRRAKRDPLDGTHLVCYVNDNLPSVCLSCASYSNVANVLSRRNLVQQAAREWCSEGTTYTANCISL